MATLSIRVPDVLRREVASVAREEGVSMNNFICFCLSMGVVQERAAMFFTDRLEGKDRNEIQRGFSRTMSRSRKGRPPSQREISRLIEEDV